MNSQENKTESPEYDDAVYHFIKWAEEKASEVQGIVTIQQPNRRLSKRIDDDWYLRNVDGPLAKVSADATVARLTQEQWVKAAEDVTETSMEMKVTCFDEVDDKINLTWERFGFQLEPWVAESLREQLNVLMGGEPTECDQSDPQPVFVDVSNDFGGFRIWIEPAWFDIDYEEADQLLSQLRSIIG